MGMTDDQIQRVFLKSDNTVKIRCFSCGREKVVTFTKELQQKTVLKVKCECAVVFPVRIERRKFYRKETSLDGVYQKDFGPGYATVPLVREKTNCRVANVSMEGAGFTVFGRHSLQKGDMLWLGFTLDNGQRSWIEKHGVARLVEGNYIGMEFDTPASSHKELGFYILP